jgi:hypothetical protein
VTRRLVLAACALAVLGGVAAPALADTGSQRHKVCVLGPSPQAPNQEGICIGWDDVSLPPVK